MKNFLLKAFDVLLDEFIDCVKILPFILLIYVLMELIESAKNKEKIEKTLSGRFSPLVAGALGVVPECGFAVMCSKLYDKGLIRTGTLIAGFLAVSDEGLIVLISGGENVLNILLFVGIKVLFAVIVGIVINSLFRNKEYNHVCPEHGDCIECGKHQDEKFHKFFLHPLFHTLTTGLLILTVSFIIGLIIKFVGEDKLTVFLNNNYYYQPLISSLVGLIPNCSSSIIISEAYMSGVLSFPALLSGLSANAGLGMIVLFKNKARIKRNVFIVVLMYLLSVILGYILVPFFI